MLDFAVLCIHSSIASPANCVGLVKGMQLAVTCSCKAIEWHLQSDLHYALQQKHAAASNRHISRKNCSVRLAGWPLLQPFRAKATLRAAGLLVQRLQNKAMGKADRRRNHTVSLHDKSH